MTPCHPPPSPELTGDLFPRILLRIPPDMPECLVRASCVCKSWRCILSDPAFCRRYRKFHRTPPLLGFVRSQSRNKIYTSFVPATAFRPTAPVHHDWLVCDARHGRVLFNDLASKDLVVWDPITGIHTRVPLPSPCPLTAVAESALTVFCAAVGCDHRGCHGGPFLVAFVCERSAAHHNLMSVNVYLSEDGTWSYGMTSKKLPVGQSGSTVVSHNSIAENTINIRWKTKILEYNMGDQKLKVIDLPSGYQGSSTVLMTAEDGTLGFATVEDLSRLCLWSRKPGPNGALAWAHYRTIELSTVLPVRSIWSKVVGYADGFGVIFIQRQDGLFTIELNSDRVKKVYSEVGATHPLAQRIFPYMSFYTLDHARGIVPLP